ncbi:MAG TPA: ABC transporter ATP-binding protein [Hyphomicrobiales bacterium]|nr:ABC transporter ATP-binding protein [Hyphomicrobiales bacterium]
MQKPLIVCRQIGKRFPNGTLALSGLDLNVGAHEFLSLLGPSGCGKSTVLRLMARLAAPTEGSIEWRGARGEPDPLAISFVFQEPTLMPWATAVANVALPLDLAGIPKREARERARAALSLVGLSGFEGAYPSELSGGMRMRVSIARAIVTEPALLLLDEPFAALDEITRFKLNNDLLELWQRTGFTVIFVTHSVFESVFLSQRIAVMAARPGRIIQEISIAEPYPRGAGFRVSPAYLGYCRQTSEWLELAMSNEGAPAASNR